MHAWMSLEAIHSGGFAFWSPHKSKLGAVDPIFHQGLLGFFMWGVHFWVKCGESDHFAGEHPHIDINRGGD